MSLNKTHLGIFIQPSVDQKYDLGGISCSTLRQNCSYGS